MQKNSRDPLEVRLKSYCRQSLFPQAKRALPALALAPLTALTPQAALAQCGNVAITPAPGQTGNIYSMDFDGDGYGDFRFDQGGFVFFTVYNRPDCGVVVPSGMPYNGFSSGPNVANLSTGVNLSTQSFVQATGANIPNSNYMLATLAGGGFGATQWDFSTAGYIGVRCDLDGDGDYNYGFVYLEIDADGNVSVDPARSGLDINEDNMATIGDCSTLVPVELVSFVAKAADGKITLNWHTATEVDNYGFNIERSENGKEFKKIGWIDGNGTTIEEQRYSFIDLDAKPNQIYYYRLQQMDFDGSHAYSDIATASLIDKDAAYVGKIAPNPASNAQATFMEVRLSQAQDVQLQIFNVGGQLMQERVANLEKGNNYVRLDIGSLIAGTYFVKTSIGASVEYRKLIVK